MKKLDTELIRSLAAPRSFERGLVYYSEGRVGKLRWSRYTVRTDVLGNRRYRVEIDLTNPVAYECDCPYDYDGACKHVAAVLLKMREERANTVFKTGPSSKVLSLFIQIEKRISRILDRKMDALEKLAAPISYRFALLRKVELIPVVEIENYARVPWPGYQACQKKRVRKEYVSEVIRQAGFLDLKPYRPGFQLCRAVNISDRDLALLVMEHTKNLRAGLWDRDECCPLFGGYVLRVNGQDMFFPQCCEDLSNLAFWKGYSSYNGHPQPDYLESGGSVFLEFYCDYEEFDPPPVKERLVLPSSALSSAVDRAEKELRVFGEHLKRVNERYGLELDDIENLLIWGGE